jgi:glutamine synthetase
MSDRAEIAGLIKRDGIHTVEVAYSDLQGHLRGKRLPAKRFLEVANHGVAFCDAALAWAIDGEVFPTDFTNFETGYPDFRAVPDLSTFRPVPWHHGSALVMCDLFSMHGDPLEVSPRRVLQQAERALAAAGYSARVSCELEFFILDRESLRPYYHGVQCYSLHLAAEVEFVLEPIRRHLEVFGIPLEGSNAEYGSAQTEVNFHHSTPVEMADQTVLFKNAVKEIARQQGVVATFMPKPFIEESGNGLHVHQSLWDKAGKSNLFVAEGKVEGLSKLGESYLAGLLEHFAAVSALSNPSINSYKRFVPDSFAATRINWGVDNRTVGVRAAVEGAGTRLESRNGGADANPYYALAANLYAGLDGVKRKLTPPKMLKGNGYVSPDPELPASLETALAALDACAMARKSFGDKVVNHYLQVFSHEVERFRTAVTDWERDRYLIEA